MLCYQQEPWEGLRSQGCALEGTQPRCGLVAGLSTHRPAQRTLTTLCLQMAHTSEARVHIGALKSDLTEQTPPAHTGCLLLAHTPAHILCAEGLTTLAAREQQEPDQQVKDS